MAGKIFINQTMTHITWIIAKRTAGGIGPVCMYTAVQVARDRSFVVTILALHDSEGEVNDVETGVKTVGLGISGNCTERLLKWLNDNPQDIVITNDVSYAESAFPHFPKGLLHLWQIHDSGKRYRDALLRNQKWIDGVICVAEHIEKRVRLELGAAGFRGLIRTIHNGAIFPPFANRSTDINCLRLLFMGRVEPLKGVFDLIPLLENLRSRAIPFRLRIVGGYNSRLCKYLTNTANAQHVVWEGFVPHERCYEIAAESDVLLMLSRKEPFGMVTIEAMAMGCVPIAYDTESGSREIIESGRSGILVSLGDTSEIADSLEVLHRDRAKLLALSTNVSARARETFSAAKMASDVVAFIEAVTKRRGDSEPTRLDGIPSVSHDQTPAARGSVYQSIPSGLREWLRNRVASNPRICYWWLNR